MSKTLNTPTISKRAAKPNGENSMTKYQVQAWMVPKPIAVDADNSLSVAYHLMRLNNVRRLPVLGKNGSWSALSPGATSARPDQKGH